LTTARRLLAKRLARHGLVLAGGGPAAAEGPAALVLSTVQAAKGFATGGAKGIPASAVAFTEGGLRALLLHKLKIVPMLLAGVALVGLGIGSWLGLDVSAQPAEQETQTPPSATRPAPSTEVSRAQVPQPTEPAKPAVQTLTGHASTVYVRFSQDGDTLATISDRTIRLWDARTRTVRHQLVGHLGPVASSAFSPNSKVLATTDARAVRLW